MFPVARINGETRKIKGFSLGKENKEKPKSKGHSRVNVNVIHQWYKTPSNF